LLLQGSFDAAAVLLAYSLEYHLKAAMLEVEDSWTTDERRLVEKSHNLKALYRSALQKGLLATSFVSFDFLEFAGDHFTRRYPSRAQELLSRKGYWSFGGQKLHTYDDAITQLDMALAELYGSARYTLGAHAIAGFGVSGSLADAFFHDNLFVLERLPAYRGAVEDEHHLNLDSDLLERPEALFARDRFPHPAKTLEGARELVKWHLAAFFRYPKKGEPDPDPSRLLSERSPLVPPLSHYSRWVVERAIREFGKGAVEVSENREEQEVVLRVFDRRAKKWHRSLVLRSGYIEGFIRNTENEAVVDRWFSATRGQFKRFRANLRIPPDHS
jgi:hypothetical protein